MYSYLDEEEQFKGFNPEVVTYLKNNRADQFPKKELVGPPAELAPVDPRVEAQKQYDEQLDRSNTGSLISNIGDVIAGKQVGSNNKFFQDQNALVKENTIGKLDADRKRKMEDATFKRESDKHDINSDQNVGLRAFLDKYQPSLRKQLGPNFDKLTVAQFPVYEKKMNDDRDFNFKVQQLAQEAALKRAELGGKNRDILKLPVENQEVVKDLAKGNAGKLSIANQIDAAMANWDNLTDDQKVVQGRQLLKTLNSVQGSDAVGAEEVKRLGSNLEFATGNIFSSNPLQLGRDLPGFKDQADLTSKAIRSAIASNNDTIDKMYRDSGINKDSNSGYRDPRIEKMAKDRGVSYETALGVVNSRKSKMAGR